MTPPIATHPRFHARPRIAPWVFVTPALVLLVLTMVLPFIYALVLSFRGIKVRGGGLGMREEVTVGFTNYYWALVNPELWEGLGRMLFIGLISAPLTMGLSLLFALLLDSKGVRLGKFSRIAIFIPYAVPEVIASLMWGFIYLPGVSPIRDVIEATGAAAPDFFGPHMVFFSIANIAVWGRVGFNMVILYTTLRGISPELYEAARIDGCNELQTAWHIKLPLLLPAVILTSLFSLIGAIQIFSEPQTLEPLSNAISTTWVPMMLVYRDSFIAMNIYSGAATSMLIAMLTTVASVALLRVMQRQSSEGGR